MKPSATVFLVGEDEDTGGLVQSIAESIEAQFQLCGCVGELTNFPVNGEGGCVVLDRPLEAGEGPLAEADGGVAGLPVVVLGDASDPAAAVVAMKRGAFDYLEKPVQPDRLSASIAAAVEDAVYRAHCRQALEGIRGRLGKLSATEREALDFATTSVMRVSRDRLSNGHDGDNGHGVRSSSARAAKRSRTGAGRSAAVSGRARRRFAERLTPPPEPVMSVADEQLAGLLDELTPRLRQTLDLLLQGDSEKQVAHKLNLSRHTVHDYVKALYRHFDVQSRGELMAKCLAAV